MKYYLVQYVEWMDYEGSNSSPMGIFDSLESAKQAIADRMIGYEVSFNNDDIFYTKEDSSSSGRTVEILCFELNKLLDF